jgi:hypothetical protein
MRRARSCNRPPRGSAVAVTSPMAHLRHLVLRSLFRTELQQGRPAPAPVDDRQPTAPAGLPRLQFLPCESSAAQRPLTVPCLEAFAFGLGGERSSSLPLQGSQCLLFLTDLGHGPDSRSGCDPGCSVLAQSGRCTMAKPRSVLDGMPAGCSEPSMEVRQIQASPRRPGAPRSLHWIQGDAVSPSPFHRSRPRA